MHKLLIKSALIASFAVISGCSANGNTKGINQSSSETSSSTELLADGSTVVASLGTGSCSDLVENVTVLKDGFQWTEGPAWDKGNKRWIFSDVMGDTEYAITPGGDLTTLREKAGFPNGHAAKSDGSFVVAQHDRTLDSVAGDGSNFMLVADTYEGNKLNSPNDVSIGNDDAIYFTDPMFGIQGFGPEKAESALGYAGVFRLNNGSLDLINNDLATPNGIAITNDQKTLIVSDTSTNSLYSIDLDSYSNDPLPAVKLAELAPIEGGGEGHGPDGLRISSDNSIWATGKGGINVLTNDGSKTCSIPFPNHVANLAFGGDNDNLILVTSADKLYTITLK